MAMLLSQVNFPLIADARVKIQQSFHLSIQEQSFISSDVFREFYHSIILVLMLTCHIKGAGLKSLEKTFVTGSWTEKAISELLRT